MESLSAGVGLRNPGRACILLKQACLRNGEDGMERRRRNLQADKKADSAALPQQVGVVKPGPSANGKFQT